jgi:hypothetical protein
LSPRYWACRFARVIAWVIKKATVPPASSADGNLALLAP